jgi:hypothetical protein
MGQSRLTFGALEDVAREISKRVQKRKPERVLVTSDVDLASLDATYRDVVSGVQNLTIAADELLKEEARDFAAASVIGILAAAASVLPQAVSLLLPRRSIATGEVTVSDLAASAAVMDELVSAGIAVSHADFRLVRTDGVYAAVEDLNDRRIKLVEKRLKLAKSEEEPESEADAATVEAIGAVVGAIDSLTTSIRATGANGGRSRLSIAALAETLHEGERVSHVLLVKAQTGSATELREDRAVQADTFATIVDAHVTFMVLDTKTGEIVDVGTQTATVMASGKVGEVPRVRPVPLGGDG